MEESSSQKAEHEAATPAPTTQGRSSGVPVLIVLLTLIIVGGGIGGFAAYLDLQSKVTELERDIGSLASRVDRIKPPEPVSTTFGFEGGYFLMEGKGDKAGADLAPDDEGDARLRLMDREGRVRVALGTFDDGPELVLFGEDGRPRVILGEDEGGGHLTLLGTHSGAGVRLRFTEDGQFSLASEKGDKPQFGIYPADTGRTPSVVVHTSDGGLGAVLGAQDLITKATGVKTSLPPSSLVLYDSEGQVLLQLPPSR
jgi:hypothetical protein